MDDKLKGLIKKHALTNKLSEEEGLKIYRAYNERIRVIIDTVDNNDIGEIRVPWLLRFIWNNKKYEKFRENRDKKQANMAQAKLES